MCCSPQVEMCQCYTDAPAWGHCMREKLVQQGTGWMGYTDKDDAICPPLKPHIENGEGIKIVSHPRGK